LTDVRNYYGLARDFGQAGYFETEHSEQIVGELKLEIKAGKLVAFSGIVGCGKTTMLRRVQEALSQYKEISAGTKADPAGLQREGLGGASQREAARDQILPERPTCSGPDPGVAE